MKILLTLRQPLLPADIGGRIRSLNLFSRLAQRAEIHVVCLADPTNDRPAIAEMKSMFHSCTPVFHREARKHSARFYLEILANQLSSAPYFLAKCNAPQFRATVEELISRNRFDLLLCDFLHTAFPLLACAFRPKVIFQHNVEFVLRKRKWQVERQPLRKRVFAAEYRRTHAIEAHVCRSFDHVLAVSEQDQRVMEREFAIDHVSTVPTGVDTDLFRPTDAPVKSGRIVFVGAMDWDPNEDAVIWFVREIFPYIRKVVPHANFCIVGRSPSPRLQDLLSGKEGLYLTGTVPDVRPYLAEAEVVVVPLRAGGGTRLKIPEAMAMGKSVVSTKVGAEGLPFHDGREIRLEDQPEKFAQAVLELLADTARRNALGKAAHEIVARNYSWESAVEQLELALERVLHPAKQTATTLVPA
jgi:polysaccharide biosynthesis protein PslH